jgi:hypothetical protein
MIRKHDKISPAKAAHAFEEWAGLFPKGFFVKLVAYADESGTGGNSAVIIIGGLVALRDEWVGFCRDWQRVLNKHSAKYFHFREWAGASSVIRGTRPPNSSFDKNPYKTWSQSKLDEFLIDLAQVAVSDGRLVVGGYVPPNQFIRLRDAQPKEETQTTMSPEEICLSYFFDSVVSTISQERRVLKRQGISFFFDHTEVAQWKSIIHNGYDFSCKKHRQFKSITIVSEGLRERVKNGDTEFLPLQAADMVAYRMRQQMENLANLDFTGPTWDKLDNILFDRMNKSHNAQSDSDRQEMLWRIYPNLKGVPYEQAMDTLAAQSKYKNANKTKK